MEWWLHGQHLFLLLFHVLSLHFLVTSCQDYNCYSKKLIHIILNVWIKNLESYLKNGEAKGWGWAGVRCCWLGWTWEYCWRCPLGPFCWRPCCCCCCWPCWLLNDWPWVGWEGWLGRDCVRVPMGGWGVAKGGCCCLRLPGTRWGTGPFAMACCCCCNNNMSIKVVTSNKRRKYTWRGCIPRPWGCWDP